jgi:hypothetical protein
MNKGIEASGNFSRLVSGPSRSSNGAGRETPHADPQADPQ